MQNIFTLTCLLSEMVPCEKTMKTYMNEKGSDKWTSFLPGIELVPTLPMYPC